MEMRTATKPASGKVSAWFDAAIATFSAVIAVATAAVGLLNSRNFFYTDDFQTQFMPLFREIGRLVLNGYWPFITDRIWHGGAILPEYQAAVLNPVSILLYVGMFQFEDPAAAAAVYALFHIGLFATGTYFLCRALGCLPRYAILASVVAPTSDWILYWGAVNWIPSLVSITWLTWAAAALVGVYRHQKWFVPASVCVALCLASGWPFTVFAGLYTATFCMIVLLFGGGQIFAWPKVRVVVALLCGGLMAAPSLLPLFPYLEFSGRQVGAWLWTMNLASLSSFGLPFYRTQWLTFSAKREAVALPMIYVAWFIPIVLANAKWKPLWQDPVTRTVSLLAVSLGMMSMLPLIGQLKWMFRFLPYIDLLLLVLVALICTREAAGALRWRFLPTILAIAVPVVLSAVWLPSEWMRYVGSGLLVLLLATATSLLGRIGGRRWIVLALSTNIAIVLVTSILYTRDGYPTYPRAWSPPFRMAEDQENVPLVRRLALYNPVTNADPGPGYWRQFRPGNTSLYWRSISINGYSPFSIISYRRSFCIGYIGETVRCGDIAENLTKPFEGTGLSVLDLARIEEIVVEEAQLAAELRGELSDGWTSSVTDSGATLFVRRLSADAPPDPISWMSGSLHADAVKQSPQLVSLDVRNDAKEAGRIVLARAWYPGWTATIAGQPVEVHALGGVFVSVDVPAGTRGRMEIVYWPAGFWLGLQMAAVGLLILVGASLGAALTHRPRKLPAMAPDMH